MEPEWHWSKVTEWDWPMLPMNLHVFIWFTWSTNIGDIVVNGFLKINCFHFFPCKSLSRHNWPTVKWVKVNLGSPLEQTVKGLSTWCYQLRIKFIDLRVLDKKVFEWFLPYIGMAAVLVMCDLNHMSKISFISQIKVPYQISLQSAQ